METKANPNPNSCLARALPHEPFFVLLARDITAPAVIRFWCEQRMALVINDEMERHTDQIEEAMTTADEFERWRAANDGAWRDAVFKRAAKIERLARAMAKRSVGTDVTWDDWIGDAEAALDEFDAMTFEEAANV